MKHTPKPLAARLLTLAAALVLSALPALAETVLIASAADWAAFANRVNNGEGALDAKLTANVTLGQDSPFVGTDSSMSSAYRGTFDGCGHILSVHWSFSDLTVDVAPFRVVSGCTIKNLHVTGAIESHGLYAASLVGKCRAASSPKTYTTISGCRSSVSVTCTHSGDAFGGGFAAHLEDHNNARIVFTNCLFDGELLGPSATKCGGFVGYRPTRAWAHYRNCLFAPSALTVSPRNSYTFSPPGVDNPSQQYFYTQPLGVTQGSDASSMSPESLVAALGSAWTVVRGQVALALFPSPAIPPDPAAEGFVYQGALRKISGAPLTGEQTVEFRLYDTATGGTPLWGRVCTVRLDGNGLFNIALSDVVGEPLEGTTSADPLSAQLAANASTPLYLGLTVAGSDGEIAPRQRILSTPYAAHAADAATAAGDFAAARRLSAAGLAVTGNASVAGNASFKSASVLGKLSVAGKILGPNANTPARGTAPVGAIVLWKGAPNQIPDGWALCNGQTVNGRKTPDLRDRFVVGAGPSYAVNNTGGKDSYTLSPSQMASHSHLYAGDDQLTYVKPGTTGYSAANNVEENTSGYDAVSEASGSARVYRTSSVGSGASIDNRPPYYALCYIMRVK